MFTLYFRIEEKFNQVENEAIIASEMKTQFCKKFFEW